MDMPSKDVSGNGIDNMQAVLYICTSILLNKKYLSTMTDQHMRSLLLLSLSLLAGTTLLLLRLIPYTPFFQSPTPQVDTARFVVVFSLLVLLVSFFGLLRMWLDFAWASRWRKIFHAIVSVTFLVVPAIAIDITPNHWVLLLVALFIACTVVCLAAFGMHWSQIDPHLTDQSLGEGVDVTAEKKSRSEYPGAGAGHSHPSGE